MRGQRKKEHMNKFPIRPINLSTTISASSIGKIYASWFYNKREALGTGFFIKIKKEESNNLYQYFFVTCEHVIPKTIIEAGYHDIEIAYHCESAHLSIDLNEERFIKEYQSFYNVDITIIELKENEVPTQYFLEPDYNMLDNYEQYIGKEIIIHQFPKGREQCFSEGNISGINKKKRQMSYRVSTEDCSSGSPVIVKDTNLVIGVHKEGDEFENYANFFDVVLTDYERENSINYKKENIGNKKIINYTKQGVLDIKTKDKRVYHDNKKKYKIFLNKVYDNNYDLRIINTYTNTEYNTQFYYNGDIFEVFDLNAYNFIIVEGKDLELNVDFDHTFHLKRKEEDEEFEGGFSYSSLSENIFYQKPTKESKKIRQKENMINNFKKISLGPYNDKDDEFPKHYNEFKKCPESYKPQSDTIKIKYEKSFESKDNISKDDKYNNTETYSYKKNDDLCNIW